MIVFQIFFYLLCLVGIVASVLNFFLLLSAVTLLVRLNKYHETLEAKAAILNAKKKLKGPYMDREPGLLDIATPQVPYDAPLTPEQREEMEMKWGKIQ